MPRVIPAATHGLTTPAAVRESFVGGRQDKIWALGKGSNVVSTLASLVRRVRSTKVCESLDFVCQSTDFD